MRSLALAIAAMALVGCGDPAVTDSDDVGQVTDMARTVPPTGKKIGTILTAAGNRARNRIDYHSGPVMQGTSAVYLIWYGNWTGNTAQAVITDMVSNLGSSPYFQVNTRYPDASGAAPSGGLIYAGSVNDSYSRGPSLSDTDLAAVVSAQLTAGSLPLDPAGVYVVLGSADVTATSGFCSAYCGQHATGTFSGTLFKYIYVGNADRCPSSCSAQSVGPNDNAGADAMANVLANELSTTVTDPTLAAWYDREGFENADKCAWTFGTTYTAANGALANVRLGARDFLLQRNWFPTKKGGVCVLSTSEALAAIAAGEDVLN